MLRYKAIKFIFGIVFILTIPSFSYDNNNIKSDSTCTDHIGLNCKILPLVIPEKDSISISINNMIHKNPYFIDKSNRIEYYIKIFKPDTNIDYKILVVKPNPSIDYKIMIYNPKSKSHDMDTENILNKYYQYNKKQNKNNSH